MDYSNYGSAYGSLASYFGQSGGTGSPGKSGGAGYSNDQSAGTTGGDSQQASAQSGSAWISAAASSTSSDKSFFSTPFQQSFGGIVNNQIIQSPGATNNANTSPVQSAPVTAAPGGYGAAAQSPLMLAVIVALVVIVALKFVK